MNVGVAVIVAVGVTVGLKVAVGVPLDVAVELDVGVAVGRAAVSSPLMESPPTPPGSSNGMP